MKSGFGSLISSNSLWYYMNAVLTTFGLWKLLPKCGVDRRWAFVPYLRIFKLAQAADMEDTGFFWMICSAAAQLCLLFASPFLDYQNNPTWVFILSASVILALAIAIFIYEIRMNLGICRMFGRKKSWLILWMFASCVPAIYWGWSDLVRYSDKVVTVGKAAAESGITAEVVAEGLTVNLKSRTVFERFRKKVLLKDIHLNLRPGRMVLLLGGSGAGKTTFINAVIGYEKADAKVTLNGIDVYLDYNMMKYDIAMVPQQDLIRYDDTVLRTLHDAAMLRLPEKLSHKELDARVNEVLRIFGLESVAGHEVEKLSGGQKKRLSIAVEFISDPSLFVLDEPDSGLDGVLARDLMTRLSGIAKEGKIVIVITHSPDRVIDLFDDVIVLAKDAERTGRLVFFGDVNKCREFFGVEKMEDVVKAVNRSDEGGEGRADELIEKFAEVGYAAV